MTEWRLLGMSPVKANTKIVAGRVKAAVDAHLDLAAVHALHHLAHLPLAHLGPTQTKVSPRIPRPRRRAEARAHDTAESSMN